MHGQTMLCVAPRSWHSMLRESQQIMSRIAKHNRVLYFEPGREPDNRLVGEMVRNAPNFMRLRSETPLPNLTVIQTPSMVPYARSRLPRPLLKLTTPAAAQVNSAIMLRHIHWAMREFAVRDPILWLFEPRYIDLVGKCGEQLSCYFNYDELHKFALNARMEDLILEYDNRLCRAVDVVFATSRAQAAHRQQHNQHTYFVPNGVNFELFNQALDPNLAVAADIAALPGPVIGFAGWLAYTIDAELLLQVAEAFPECSLALVGRNDFATAADPATYEQLRNRPNVFFLGHKTPEQLPSYLRAFDVALMPYRLIDHVRPSYPLKLNEYLAAGRAIVATALDEVQFFRDVIRVAENYDEYVTHVRAALADHSAEAIATRVAVAKENTWDKRVETIYAAFERQLAQTAGAPQTEARSSTAPQAAN